MHQKIIYRYNSSNSTTSYKTIYINNDSMVRVVFSFQSMKRLGENIWCVLMKMAVMQLHKLFN
jgi:hypothetical protein